MFGGMMQLFVSQMGITPEDLQAELNGAKNFVKLMMDTQLKNTELLTQILAELRVQNAGNNVDNYAAILAENGISLETAPAVNAADLAPIDRAESDDESVRH